MSFQAQSLAAGALADPLARHFADWGAVSRFAIGGETPIRTTGSAQPLDTEEPLPLDQHVKPLFRERDRDSMRFAFDLWSLEDVSAHADAILARLETGSMPCDGAWPAERIAVFRRWIHAGKPA